MKNLVWVSCMSLMALASAMEGKSEKPSVVTTEKMEVKAIIENINYDKREVTIKGPKGTHVVKVGDEVRNLDQVKKGDEILATVYESVAYSVVKKGEAPDASAEDVVYRAEKGQKPAGMAVSTRQISARVQDIDHKKRDLTLVGPEGNSFTINVDERVRGLERIKKGDEVVATYTEAVAIAVRTPGR